MSDDGAIVTGKTWRDFAFDRTNADRVSASEYYRASSQYLILINGVTTSAVIAYLTSNAKEFGKTSGPLLLLICVSAVLFTASVVVAGVYTYLRMQTYDQWGNYWEMILTDQPTTDQEEQKQKAIDKSNLSDKYFKDSLRLFAFGAVLFIGSIGYQGYRQSNTAVAHEVAISVKF